MWMQVCVYLLQNCTSDYMFVGLWKILFKMRLIINLCAAEDARLQQEHITQLLGCCALIMDRIALQTRAYAELQGCVTVLCSAVHLMLSLDKTLPLSLQCPKAIQVQIKTEGRKKMRRKYSTGNGDFEVITYQRDKQEYTTGDRKQAYQKSDFYLLLRTHIVSVCFEPVGHNHKHNFMKSGMLLATFWRTNLNTNKTEK